MPGQSTVRTQRLLLRRWTEPHRDAYAVLSADPVVMEHFPEPLTREQSDALVDRAERAWQDHGFGLWAVERLDTGEFIGHTGLNPAVFDAPFTPAVEVGWRLGVAHWGQGFATEAARAALEFGFDRHRLEEIVSFTAHLNERSWRVMERLGMRRDVAGDFDHPNVPAGHRLRPHRLYRLARSDWAASTA